MFPLHGNTPDRVWRTRLLQAGVLHGLEHLAQRAPPSVWGEQPGGRKGGVRRSRTQATAVWRRHAFVSMTCWKPRVFIHLYNNVLETESSHTVVHRHNNVLETASSYRPARPTRSKPRNAGPTPRRWRRVHQRGLSRRCFPSLLPTVPPASSIRLLHPQVAIMHYHPRRAMEAPVRPPEPATRARRGPTRRTRRRFGRRRCFVASGVIGDLLNTNASCGGEATV